MIYKLMPNCKKLKMNFYLKFDLPLCRRGNEGEATSQPAVLSAEVL